jgi:hypothetical protein
MFYGVGYSAGTEQGRVAVSRPVNQEEVYGASVANFWRMVDDRVGPLAVMPAAIAFHLRYGLPVNRFREAIYPHWYGRDFRSLAWGNRDLAFSDPLVRSLALNANPTAAGEVPASPRVSVVWSPSWPFATHVVVSARSGAANSLRVGQGHWFGGTVWFGPALDMPGDGRLHDYEFSIPAGVWGSGPQESVFEFEPYDLDKVELVNLRVDDRALRPPAFER